MRLLLAVALLLAAAPAGAAAAPLPVRDGADGRVLLDEGWRFSRTGRAPWTPVTVPHAWNALDDSAASMRGGVGHYRLRLRVPDPSADLRWRLRFEAVDHQAVVSLNGREIGRHRGAYLPWEVALGGLRRDRVNDLRVRVDSRRRETDLPPAKETADGVPSGGWFTSSGIVRDVYLRPVRGVDLRDVLVLPELPCEDARCDARVRVQATVKPVRGLRAPVRVTGTIGKVPFTLGHVRPGDPRGRRLEATAVLPRPRLWSPADPELYRVRLEARAGGTLLAGWTARTGVRRLDVTRGRLRLNGEPVRLDGVGYHEDVRGKGRAISRADRAWLVAEARAAGAEMMRTHYPPGADLHELADRAGVLLWSEVPVYSVRDTNLKKRRVRGRALAALRENVLANGSHPSVLTWSIGNELAPVVGPTQGAYIADAARLLRDLDPTRPVSLATFGYPSTPCQPRYAPLDLIGVNEYFGWYTGPGGEVFDRDRLSPFLDQVRACYPDQAMMVTEFGAEANRDGPVEEKGTWAFQRAFVDHHLAVLASKPWLSGTSYWALNEFRVRPEWEGGNPRPEPPVHQKGLLTYDGERKPAWEDLRRWYDGEAG